MGFRVHDVVAFFRQMAERDPDKKVNIDRFVKGCMRLKGTSSCFEMQSVIVLIENLREVVDEMQMELQKQVKARANDPDRSCSRQGTRSPAKLSRTPSKEVVQQ